MIMKIFLVWFVIIAVFLLVPINVATGFMMGSFFGIIWMAWYISRPW